MRDVEFEWMSGPCASGIWFWRAYKNGEYWAGGTSSFRWTGWLMAQVHSRQDEIILIPDSELDLPTPEELAELRKPRYMKAEDVKRPSLSVEELAKELGFGHLVEDEEDESQIVVSKDEYQNLEERLSRPGRVLKGLRNLFDMDDKPKENQD